MNITIITVGKLKESYLKSAMEQYSKELKKRHSLSIIELPDEKTPDNASEKEELQIKEREGEAILRNIKDNAFVLALAIEGKMLTTEALSKYVDNLKTKDIRELVFIIGGSLGLSPQVLKRSDYKLSFSKMTFPHQLMRVILLEQLNRVLN